MIITTNSFISIGINKGQRIRTIFDRSKYQNICNSVRHTETVIHMSSEVQPSPSETVTLSKNLIINISVTAIAVGIILLFISWQFDMMNSNTKIQFDMMNSNTKMELDAIKSQVSSLNFRYDALGTAAVIVAGVFAILGNFAKVSD
jgi:hypothetical protein